MNSSDKDFIVAIELGSSRIAGIAGKKKDGTILKTKLRLRVIIAIKVAVPPDHPEQEVGATYDYTGVVIHAVFNNGGEEDVTNQCIYNPVENSAITAEILNP